MKYLWQTGSRSYSGHVYVGNHDRDFRRIQDDELMLWLPHTGGVRTHLKNKPTGRELLIAALTMPRGMK